MEGNGGVHGELDNVGSLMLESLNFKIVFDAMFLSLMFKDEHSEGVREQVFKEII